MNVPWWVAELAAAFWEEVGETEPFPRFLRRPILRAFPLAVLLQTSLSTSIVREWLHGRRIAYPLEGADRPLRACLIARDGGGFIFIDGGDEAAEQRFSLAHELAHFLRHYWQPRRRASARLGGRILQVFDGLRPPHPAERVRAILAGIPLGFHAHLMGRDTGAARPEGPVAVAEAEADRLAFELLAPAEVLAERMASEEVVKGRARVVTHLRESFGLPAAQANDYAEVLFPTATPDPLLVRLGVQS